MKALIIGLMLAVVFLLIFATIMIVLYFQEDIKHFKNEHEMQKKIDYYIKQLEDRNANHE